MAAELLKLGNVVWMIERHIGLEVVSNMRRAGGQTLLSSEAISLSASIESI